MTPYRDQAIRDVAAALLFDAEVLAGMVRADPDLLCNAGPAMVYTVAQRERVLELETNMKHIAAHMNADDDESYRADDPESAMDTVYSIASSAIKIEAQLQQKEAQR